ncbi:hypothetical protein CAOG_00693 [Capsaspora owczarzaki ATCC 30864]|nr:hypothetical protein CAOG_00693 [Capsaspora owczarzaki ATCC 30864]|eukprot:XP_004365564.1 hypothetical protein CAOG_00693 [Capsaspora owczarzaki ATCC 30864]
MSTRSLRPRRLSSRRRREIARAIDEEQMRHADQASAQCVICLSSFTERGRLPTCPHLFCAPCIQAWADVNNACPMCKLVFRVIIVEEIATKLVLRKIRVESREQPQWYADQMPIPDETDEHEEDGSGHAAHSPSFLEHEHNVEDKNEDEDEDEDEGEGEGEDNDNHKLQHRGRRTIARATRLPSMSDSSAPCSSSSEQTSSATGAAVFDFDVDFDDDARHPPPKRSRVGHAQDRAPLRSAPFMFQPLAHAFASGMPRPRKAPPLSDIEDSDGDDSNPNPVGSSSAAPAPLAQSSSSPPPQLAASGTDAADTSFVAIESPAHPALARCHPPHARANRAPLANVGNLLHIAQQPSKQANNSACQPPGSPVFIDLSSTPSRASQPIVSQSPSKRTAMPRSFSLSPIKGNVRTLVPSTPSPPGSPEASCLPLTPAAVVLVPDTPPSRKKRASGAAPPILIHSQSFGSP